MRWNEFMTEYLSFSHRERIGIVVLASLVLIVFLLPAVVYNKSQGQLVVPDTAWIAAARRLEIREPAKSDAERSGGRQTEYAYQYDRSVNSSPLPPSLFYFDPNTLDAAGWKKLGIKDKTVQTIQRYLSKGGHFYKPGDLQKVYGLRADDYTRLESYIRIENKEASGKPAEYSRRSYEPKHFSYSVIDINTADTSAWVALPGIGSKLASRIVGFREKLGGFYSVDQVAETYGLPDSTFQKIRQYMKLEAPSLKKININAATIEELKAHPYIKYHIAKSIISFRNEHGDFSKIEDIKNVMTVTSEIYEKIAPYLSLK